MSPSTKNLREKVSGILNQYRSADPKNEYYYLDDVEKDIVSLLSSELSVTVKETKRACGCSKCLVE